MDSDARTGEGVAIRRADSLLRIDVRSARARWRTFGTEWLWINLIVNGCATWLESLPPPCAAEPHQKIAEARVVAEHDKVRFAFVMSSGSGNSSYAMYVDVPAIHPTSTVENAGCHKP